MTTQAEIAKVLETTEKNVLVRAAGLKLLPTCGRCGGSGRYSFNQMDGDRCFGCKGSGQRMPKPAELPAVLAAAESCKADGRFAAYMNYLDCKRITKNATARAMKAWTDTGISAAYNWRHSHGGTPREDGYVNPNFCQRDCDIAAINAKMCKAYERVSEAPFALHPSTEGYHARVVALAGILSQALADIEAANQEFIAYVKGG